MKVWNFRRFYNNIIVSIDINKCDPNPCVHGKCTDLPDGLGDYKCDCEQGWKGMNCDNSNAYRIYNLL